MSHCQVIEANLRWLGALGGWGENGALAVGLPGCKYIDRMLSMLYLELGT